MRYRDPELRAMLAGEYVLGTLIGAARRRFERLMRGDPVLRGEVDAWEAKLYALVESLPGLDPPRRVWEALEARVRPAHRPAPLWETVGFWRMGAIAAAACALLAVVALGITMVAEPPTRYVSVVTDNQDRGAWIINFKPTLASLEVRPLRTQTLDADRSFELWLLPAGAGPPASLGLLSPDGESTLDLTAQLTRALPSMAGFAVSLEPRGGSPTGQPTGPVLYQGSLIAL